MCRLHSVAVFLSYLNTKVIKKNSSLSILVPGFSLIFVPLYEGTTVTALSTRIPGCASPGVDDDAQMNAMTAAAIRFAVEAAAVVGWTGDNATKEVAAWGAIAAGLVIPFNASLGGGVHTMPVGRNGLPVISTPRSYSCPEDINYLSYPLGPSLGVDAESTRRDMQWHLTTTCLENPGMVRVCRGTM